MNFLDHLWSFFIKNHMANAQRDPLRHAATVTVGDLCNMERVYTFNEQVPAEIHSFIYQTRHTERVDLGLI